MIQKTTYTLRRKVFKFMGARFDIFDANGVMVLHAAQKAFKLKEDIRLYADENKTDEVMLIQARAILDFAAAYDVFDSHTGEKIGALKRKGWQGFVRDEWIVMDRNDQEIGVCIEDSLGLALVRRLVMSLIPQNYDLMIGGERAADLRQRFNPFIYKLDIDLTQWHADADVRMGIAAAVMIAAVEQRQG